MKSDIYSCSRKYADVNNPLFSYTELFGKIGFGFCTTFLHSCTSIHKWIFYRFPSKIILLVRDPRGVYASRSNIAWCQSNQECSNIQEYCSIASSNYESFNDMVKEYPDQLRQLFSTTKYVTNIIESSGKIIIYCSTCSASRSMHACMAIIQGVHVQKLFFLLKYSHHVLDI